MKRGAVITTLVLLAIALFCAFWGVMSDGLRLARHNILASPSIEKEGLILPTVRGNWDSDKITIYYKVIRRLNPVTIERWKRLEGVVGVEERDYSVEITRSRNYEWDEIFPPPDGKRKT